MSYKYITIERKEHIAVVTLNRPEKLNALSFDLMKEIEKRLKKSQKNFRKIPKPGLSFLKERENISAPVEIWRMSISSQQPYWVFSDL